MKAKVLTNGELVYRLIEIRQGINIAPGADRVYTCESVAKEYARNHTEIALAAADFILDQAAHIIASTGISPRGLGCIYADLIKKPGEAYTKENKFPFEKLCKQFGYSEYMN